MVTFVYRLTNTVTGKIYVGKAVDVTKRWYHHRRAARLGSPLPVHRAIRKHGPRAFLIETLSRHPRDADANAEERRLIAAVPATQRYNVAKGGDGGHTMTQRQLDAQYAIHPESYDEFRDLFGRGLKALEIAARFGVSHNAVRRCAGRLGLSFKVRRSPASKPPRPPRKRRRHVGVSRARFTPEERSRRRAVANAARGIDEETMAKVRELYFGRHLTAKEVGSALGLPSSTVRGAVNRLYARMPAADRAVFKKTHGSIVRRGDRNPNAKAFRARPS